MPNYKLPRECVWLELHFRVPFLDPSIFSLGIDYFSWLCNSKRVCGQLRPRQKLFEMCQWFHTVKQTMGSKGQ